MKAKNQHLYSKDQEKLKQWAEESRSAGRDVLLEDGHLTVYALPQKRKQREDKNDSQHKSKRERWAGKARD